jgi:diacylglycerol kinase (ATP)
VHSNQPIHTAIVIYNPVSGRGKAKQYACKVKESLLKRGYDVKGVFSTQYAGHAQQKLVPQWHEKIDLLVVVSGDGTLREVVSALVESCSSTCLGFVPLGNANVVARELSIPIDCTEAIDVILNNNVRLVDVGLFTTSNGGVRYFLAMLEVGRGAKIVHIAEQLRYGPLKTLYRWWGDLVYVIAGLISFQRDKPNSFDLVEDNRQLPGTFYGAVISSMATYSKGWSLCPDAQYDDGLLNVTASHRKDLLTYACQILAAKQKKRLQKSWIHTGTASFYEVTSDHDLYIQADGDGVVVSNTVSVEVVPRAFRILTPK